MENQGTTLLNAPENMLLNNIDSNNSDVSIALAAKPAQPSSS